ncbi:MAG: hydrogenase formation protein HypD [Candidatus Aminicenantes bacterium]|nr:hydrogenase formation protein HypD [Candidatus Aminicenantes bacterium]
MPNDLYHDRRVIAGLLSEIASLAKKTPRPVRLMEVCGTHTMTIHRHGLKDLLLEAGVEMISGPGCPVCITPDGFHEAAIRLVTKREDFILATFGDMTRVPTRLGSLQTAVPASGSMVKVVYSPEDSLELARLNPAKGVVFFGSGFETTIPAVTLTAGRARTEGRANFSVLTAFWVIPPPIRAILSSGEVRISGFLYPGHVSAVIGLEPYEFVAREFGLPGAVTGFEPGDILLGVRAVLEQIRDKHPRVVNAYPRVVRAEGNPAARAVMEKYLEPYDALWRGLGRIPQSGLRFKLDYASVDAAAKYGLHPAEDASDAPGCRCGEVLRGVLAPPECRLFGRTCTPETPRGPCMVSFEGACFVHHKFRGPSPATRRKK